MCLTKVIEQYDQPSTFIMGGRKQFSGLDVQPRFSTYALHGSSDVDLDKWIKADTSQQVLASDGKKYESGFHVYDEDTKETNRAPYRLVFVRCVSAIGEEGERKVAIAREMYVPSKPNGWPPKPGDQSDKQKAVGIGGRIKKMVSGTTGNA